MARVAVITITAPNVGKHRKGARITLPENDPDVARWRADKRCTVTLVAAPESGEPVQVGHRAAMAATAVEGHLDAALAVRANLPPGEVAGYVARIRAKHIVSKIAELVCTPGAALPDVQAPAGLVEQLAELLGCPAEPDAVLAAVELAVTPADVEDVEPTADAAGDAWATLRADLDLAADADPAAVVAAVAALLDARDTPDAGPAPAPEGAGLARLILGQAMKDPAAFTVAGLVSFAALAGFTLPNGADKLRKEQIVALIEEALAASAPAPAGST